MIFDDVVMLGTTYFPMISLAAWDIVLSAAMDLRPIVEHITLERRYRLIAKITRSKCLTAAKSLAIRREVLHATTSIQKIIQEADNNHKLVLSIMSKWRRELFDRTRKQTNNFLQKHRGLQTAALLRAENPPKAPRQAGNPKTHGTHSTASSTAPLEPKVISLVDDEHDQLSLLSSPAGTPAKHAPPNISAKTALNKKRKAPPDTTGNNRASRPAKNSLDGQTPPSPPSSITSEIPPKTVRNPSKKEGSNPTSTRQDPNAAKNLQRNKPNSNNETNNSNKDKRQKSRRAQRGRSNRNPKD
jgi:hypothetical protein